ncbi:hypothetical protein AZF37_08980 [endosymbiont 'TC1' of Trimyema compressum]|uniref:DUF4064 domain-containing protein n=1 Tax=endosymbiont 'TC1' of Trimyema compressum TaxID=243899 RepID=UPI0007F04D56|nr:DUF4064 domain-containing protein [endosymbiont 'TC1' of Trimyema compressum]AMP21258.1 hypothetical protein AZF37_08980 [endosymbiont 'TC1' of Trimyema compressum]
MKRKTEFVLGIVAIVIAIIAIIISFVSLSAFESPMMLSALKSSGITDVNKYVADITNQTYISIVVCSVLSVIVLITSIMIKKDKSPLICGIIFLMCGVLGFFFGFGFCISNILVIVAGFLLILKKNKDEKLEYVKEGE